MLRPLDTAARERKSLDGLRRFAFDAEGVGREAGWFDGTLPGTLEAAVPASYNDLFADASARDHLGDVWYQTSVRVPAGWQGKRVVLRLGSATHRAVVWVGGIQVTGVAGGILGSEPFPTFTDDTINDATRDVHAQAIRELVARDKNHPCVVLWSIANEPESDNGWYVNTHDLAAAESAWRTELEAWAGDGKPIIITEYGADTMPGVSSGSTATRRGRSPAIAGPRPPRTCCGGAGGSCAPARDHRAMRRSATHAATPAGYGAGNPRTRCEKPASTAWSIARRVPSGSS
jgi:hypothetical protein